uniref:Sugar phosphate transporter domain-containing protein n=1 Tax=Oryza punctata TaxID=4537 RepID=A0A0E0M8U5_ORYPU
MSSATDGAASRLGVAGALGMSVTSSVAIVICNKYLISTLGFFFATTLTSWHLMVTFCTLYVAQRLRFFEAKPIDAQTVVSFGLLNGISIGLLNLCLGFNSVGFYQANDQAGHHTIHHALGNHISEQEVQRRLKVSSTQLLYQSSPYQSAVLLVTGPFVDKLLTNRDVFAFTYTFQVMAFIVLSCSIAVCVNFSTFMVIGTTSPVTYQVLGHLKTCLILSFGYVLLRDPFTFRNVAGILVAIFGMGLYSSFSVSESRNKKLADGPSPPLPLSSSSQMGEMNDAEPLLGGGGGAAAKSSPWNEMKGLQSFDEMGEMNDAEPLLGGGGGAAAKSSPWNEMKGLQSFDEVPRTAKSAFSRS